MRHLASLAIVTLFAGACGAPRLGGCPAGYASCGSECVNLAADPYNCGACGNACPAGSACAGGSCSGGAADGGAPGSVSACPELSSGPEACPVYNYPPTLVNLVAGSGAIFRGTVTAVDAVTKGMEGIVDPSDAAVVQVDYALMPDPGELLLAGSSVTVVYASPPTVSVGYQGYFFANVSTLGASVAVTLVAQVDPGTYPNVDSDVPAIEALLADRALYRRMLAADAVVAGTVVSVAPPSPSAPASEHDPLWAEAQIALSCTFRTASGFTIGPIINIAFASSADIAWYQSPKLTVGEQAVFLLQHTAKLPPPNGLDVVVDPLDVQPPAQRQHLADLLVCPPELKGD